MNFNRPPFTNCVDPLMRLALEVDVFHRTLQQRGKLTAYVGLVRPDLRSLTDHGRIDVSNPQPPASHPANRFGQKVRAVPTVMAWIVVREELADVGLADRAKQRVGHGMQQRVAI